MTMGRSLRKRWRQAALAFRPRSLVLLYHRVAELGSDPQLLAVSPRHFEEQLELLRRHSRPVALDALGDRLARGEAAPDSVVVTFDDGYADNLLAARPLLEKHAIPATVYVTADGIGSGREFWWDELERLLLQPARLPTALALSVAGREHRWALSIEEGPPPHGWNVLGKGAQSPRQRLYGDVAKLLHPLAEPERAVALGSLRSWAGLGAAGRASHRSMSAEEVARLDAGGLVRVGAHTVTHTRLSSLDPAEQRREVQESKARLETIVGREVTTFSYPFGYRGSYTAQTVELVREAGFRTACSNFAGVVTPRTSRLELPRFVVRDWDGDTFSRKLRSWRWVAG